MAGCTEQASVLHFFAQVWGANRHLWSQLASDRSLLSTTSFTFSCSVQLLTHHGCTIGIVFVVLAPPAGAGAPAAADLSRRRPGPPACCTQAGRGCVRVRVWVMQPQEACYSLTQQGFWLAAGGRTSTAQLPRQLAQLAPGGQQQGRNVHASHNRSHCPCTGEQAALLACRAGACCSISPPGLRVCRAAGCCHVCAGATGSGGRCRPWC